MKQLGKGGFGTVYLAKNIASEELFAIKAIKRTSNDQEDSYRTELNIIKRINHPNIARVYKTYEDKKYYFIVMELCEGGELLDYVANKKYLTELETADIMRQAMYSVNFLH